MPLWFAQSEINEADIVILSVPLDETATFMHGTHLGPTRIKECAETVESYSPYFKIDLNDIKIADCGEINLKNSHNSISSKLALIQDAVGTYLGNAQKPLLLGGEHTLSMAAIQAGVEKYPDLAVLHLDAHTDMRDIGEGGNKIAHDTVMYRVLEVLRPKSLIQAGIRSFAKEELERCELLEINQIKEIRNFLDNSPVWLTFDLDVLDPSIMPAVGTPEPNGVTYREVIDLLLELKDVNVIGADLVEFNPLAADFPAPCVLAANLLRELCCLLSS